MKISENISWKVLQDKVVAVNLTNGAYYTMNPVACTVWQLTADGKTADEITTAVSEEYDVDYDTALADVNEQLAYWKSEGMLSD